MTERESDERIQATLPVNAEAGIAAEVPMPAAVPGRTRRQVVGYWLDWAVLCGLLFSIGLLIGWTGTRVELKKGLGGRTPAFFFELNVHHFGNEIVRDGGFWPPKVPMEALWAQGERYRVGYAVVWGILIAVAGVVLLGLGRWMDAKGKKRASPSLANANQDDVGFKLLARAFIGASILVGSLIGYVSTDVKMTDLRGAWYRDPSLFLGGSEEAPVKRFEVKHFGVVVRDATIEVEPNRTTPIVDNIESSRLFPTLMWSFVGCFVEIIAVDRIRRARREHRTLIL